MRHVRFWGRWALVLLVLISVITACDTTTPSQPEPTSPPAAIPQPSEFPDIDSFITELMELYDIPGAGVALVRDGEVLHVQGYGVRSTATGEPVTPETLFAIGSVTKSVTALGIMQLVGQDQITLDAPVATYLPNFTLADPNATQRVTVRHLLAQTSGLPGGADAAWYGGQITSLDEAVDYAAGLSLAAAPGTAHIYSNYNYAIAGYLLEQVSGQSWDDYLRTHILNLLEMSDATFDIQATLQTPNHAVPHSLAILEGMQPRQFVSLAGIASAGALNASARGMGNYVLLQLNHGMVNGQQVIDPGLLDIMHTQQAAYPPQPPIGPTGFQTNGYALGWFTAEFNGRQVLWHNGSIDGFYTIVMFIPSENVGIAVLSNAGLGTGSLFTLAASLGLLEQLMGVEPDRDVVAALNEEAAFDPLDRQAKLNAARNYDVDPAEWTPLLGEYSGSGGTVRIEARNGSLYVIQPGAQQRELIPYGPMQFLVPNRSRDGLITTYDIRTGDNGVLMLYRDGIPIGSRVPA